MSWTKPEPGDWTPKRRGPIYCAPACGANCTYAAFRLAQTRALALSRALADEFGGTWTVKVWENMGWYFRVSRGTLQVYAHYDGGTRYYITLMGYESGGRPELHVGRGFPSAARAVRAQIRLAKQELNRLAREIAELQLEIR